MVILVDEYDKPLLQTIGNEALQTEYRSVLKPFYGVLKSCDLNLKNGFAGLPASMNGLIGKDRYDSRLRIRSLKNTDRCSKPVCPFISHYDYTPDAARVQCMLITDRSAYNPDETLHFKAVLYKGVYSLEAVTGKQAEVILLDAEDKQVDSIRLTSNEFGSIDGSFVLKRGGRNGSYKINVKVDGRTVGYKDVTGDDFVLPTFDLVFDKQAPVREQGAPIIVGGTVKAYSGHSLRNAKVRYRIETNSGMTKSVDLTLDADGHFEIPVQDDKNQYWCNVKVTVTDVTGETLSFNRFVFLREEPVKRIETKYFFDELTNDDGTLKLRAVASDKTTWMLIEVFGEGGRFISGETRKVSPVNGRAETTIEYNIGPEDGLVANVSVMYFQDKQSYRHTSIVRKVDHRYDLPLSFTRFLDTTKPGAQYTFIIKTAAGVECAASIFDKSTERIHSNNWWRVRPDETPAPDIFYSSVCGTNDSYVRRAFRNESGMVMLSKATAYEAVPALEDAVERSGIGSSADKESSSAGGQEIELREDFATTIAWEPYLRSDDKGNISFTFTNADKLSTFVVSLFAHTKDLRNATLRKEFTVTIPVKASMTLPQYLYNGDTYSLSAGLSSQVDRSIRGTLTLYQYENQLFVIKMSGKRNDFLTGIIVFE